MNVLEARESESLEKLAADTASTNHKDFLALQKKIQNPQILEREREREREREIRVFEGEGEYLNVR